MPDIRTAVQEHRNLKAELLALYPELAEDDPALNDTLQGESNLDRVIAALIAEALDREAQADGITAYIKKLQERRSRLVAGAERLRSMALWGCEEGGIAKLNEPTFTATLGKAPSAVVITDEDRIPPDYWRVKREADKASIAKALKDGTEIPGCQLGNRRTTLVIRTS